MGYTHFDHRSPPVARPAELRPARQLDGVLQSEGGWHLISWGRAGEQEGRGPGRSRARRTPRVWSKTTYRAIRPTYPRLPLRVSYANARSERLLIHPNLPLLRRALVGIMGLSPGIRATLWVRPKVGSMLSEGSVASLGRTRLKNAQRSVYFLFDPYDFLSGYFLSFATIFVDTAASRSIDRSCAR
jgi:hypothetical protein